MASLPSATYGGGRERAGRNLLPRGEEVRPLVVGLVSAICWAGGELIASYWNDSWMIKLAGLLKGLGATSAALFGFGIWHPTLRAYTPRIVAGLTGVATAGTLVAGGRYLYDVPSISERLSALLDTLRSRLQERGASVPLLGSSGDPFDDLEAGTYGSMGTTTGRSGRSQVIAGVNSHRPSVVAIVRTQHGCPAVQQSDRS